MRDAGFTTATLPLAFGAYKDALRREGRFRYSNGKLNNAVIAAAGFVRYAEQEGVVPRAPAAHSLDAHPLLTEFRSWMTNHRGLAQSSLDLYQRTIVKLLAAVGDDPRKYAAQPLRAFALEQARPYAVKSANVICAALRSFLRFLGATAKCAAGMEHAIPSFCSRQLASPPRYIEPDQVQRVIDVCIPDDSQGMRDRAILLLLARIGLRSSEVASVNLVDLDWKNGRLAVCGKSRRREWLPLPQEVGDAIMDYLRCGRAPLRTPRVFTSVVAPFRPLTRGMVGHIVLSALRRAGVKAPTNGAHTFRHSAATAMLRQGVSLAGIGAVLRHRSPRMTEHYAKVDFGLLSEIAQPWPGVKSC
jgi:site-specific recombinase XerD